jgi:hypothetical protein
MFPRFARAMPPVLTVIGALLGGTGVARGGYMRTNWRNHHLRHDAMNRPTCGTPEINDSFRVLCPALYKKRFGDLEPL